MCLYSTLATPIRAILHTFTRARVYVPHLGCEGGWSRPHCNSRNIHYPEKPNATSNYYVGRDTAVAKGMVGVEDEKGGRNNNAKARMSHRAERYERRIQTVRHDISSVSVAVHYDCILSWVSYMHIRYLIPKWKLLYYVVHVSRARSIRIINLADSAVISKRSRRPRNQLCCFY